MIYLIKSPAYQETRTGKAKFFTLLKIGYTEDKNLKPRMIPYIQHNPTSKLISFIRGATRTQEKKVQLLFREFRYSGYGKEWFIDTPEIINFFKSSPSLDYIDSLPSKKDIIKEVEEIASQIIPGKKYLLSQAKKELGDNISVRNFIKFLENEGEGI